MRAKPRSGAQGGYSVLGKLKTFPFPAFPKGRAGSPPARNPAQRRLPKSPALSERSEKHLARAFPSPLSLVPPSASGQTPSFRPPVASATGKRAGAPRSFRGLILKRTTAPKGAVPSFEDGSVGVPLTRSNRESTRAERLRPVRAGLGSRRTRARATLLRVRFPRPLRPYLRGCRARRMPR